MYLVVVSKLMPATGVPALDALRDDRHYVLLVPVALPVLLLFVYLNWFGFKLYRHSG